VRDAEALRAGWIYFVFPTAKRRRGFCREELAALAVLAVRASSALSSRSTAAGPSRRRRGAVTPLVFMPRPEEDEQKRPRDKKTNVAVNHSQHDLHRSRATWTISLVGPTCKDYQTAKNKQNKDGMACKAKKFRAVAPVCGHLF